MKIKLVLFFLLISSILNSNTFSLENVYEFNADKVRYENKKETIIAQGNAKIYDQKGKKIFSDTIYYNKKTGIIKTYTYTRFEDNLGNKIFTNNLIFNTITNEFASNQKVKIIDNKKNIIELDNIQYNTSTKEGYGENYKSFLSDGSKFIADKIFFNLNNGQSKILNSNYTTCSNKEGSCPWWSIKSSETKHDNNKKILTHKNTILKIKKLPVLYLPYLEHPDPSVKRKSGILPPTLKNIAGVGRGIQLPYFIDIDLDEDATITPLYYLNQKPLILTEYRKKFKNSYLVLDSSYFLGYKSFNETENNPGSRNHLFVDYSYNFETKKFKKNKLNIQLQRVSESNYLKKHQINTLLVKEDYKQLENKIQLLSYNDFSGLDLNFKVLEDLNKHDNTKYEYLLPTGTYSKNLKLFDQRINFNSDFFLKRKAGEKSANIINKLDSNSDTIISKIFGSSHILKTNISNINLYNEEDNNYINSINNYFTIAVENTLPLYKKKEKTEEIISPKLFAKYTTGRMKSVENNDQNLFYSDIFSMNRSSQITNPETGVSLGIGVDYEITKKNLDNDIYFKNLMGIGQVFRKSKMDQMPISSSLNNKQSSFAGFYNLSFLGNSKKKNVQEKVDFLNHFAQNKLDIKYDFNLNKNLSSLDKNTFNISSVIFNKLLTNVIFDEKNNYAGNERKVNYGVDILLSNSFYLTTKVIENLKSNLKESETYGLFYENDCIKIGLNLKKDFYSNSTLSNNKSLFLNIIIKPFGNDISPELSTFVD